jgi:prepilin-type N-terminal cleavage/methylation domain-containing protein
MKGKKGFIKAIKDEKGFNLMEVALAMALLGIVAVAYLGAMATGSRAIIIADERATAESLARTQMEYVRQQDYIDYSKDPHGDYYTISTPAYYIVDLSVTPFDPDTGDPYGQAGGVFDQDDGIQNITVTIYHIIEEEQKEIFALEGYRSNR